MKVAGFSFVRNAIKFDYPVVEAIRSVLPLCDVFILVLGDSEDDTEALIKTITSEKIKIIKSKWDDTNRKGGSVLADQCNIALKNIPVDCTWAIYIQADELIPEYNYQAIRQAMQKWKSSEQVDGLLFNYRHFYGTYDFIADSSNWYRNEVRIIKNNSDIYSYQDAQGFRKVKNKKLKVKAIEAWIHHYGWVKHPSVMQRKQLHFNKLWHDDEWIIQNIETSEIFDYSKIDSICRFEGKHPALMLDRVQRQNWKIEINPNQLKMNWIQRIRYWIEKKTGYRIGEYKNYKTI